MSEEIKEEVTDETAAEEKAETKQDEVKDENPQQTVESKKKKINKYTPEELIAKINEMEEKNLTHSVYYKHLINRKNELETFMRQS